MEIWKTHRTFWKKATFRKPSLYFIFFSLVSRLIVHFCPLKKKVEYECIFVQEIQDFLTLFFVYFSYVITEEFVAHGANINCLGLSLVDSLSHHSIRFRVFLSKNCNLWLFQRFLVKHVETCLVSSNDDFDDKLTTYIYCFSHEK